MPSAYTHDFITKTAIAHLRDCLRLQNNSGCLNVIIESITEVGRRHLGPVVLASHRKAALKAIGEELKELYPDIFADDDSEKRVYIAVQIAIRQHNLKKQNKVPQEGTSASESVLKKHSLSAPKQGSDEQDANQAPVNATKYMKHKPSKKKVKKIYEILPASTPDCDEQNENQALMDVTTDKASDTRRVNVTPHIRRSPSASMQGIDEQDEDHSPADVAMHAMDMASDIRRSLLAPLQGFDGQDEYQPLMDATTHTTDKASGTIKATKILDNQRSSSILMHEHDESQAPVNDKVDKIHDKRKVEMPLSKRMALNLASIVNTPSAPSMFASPSLGTHASQPLGSASSPTSLPRRRVLFVPHVSKSQPQLSNTPSQPSSTSSSKYSSLSTRFHPATSADTCSNFSTSQDNSMPGSVVSQSDKPRSVHHFLEACVPSMSYLLPRFIEYGCTHEGFLLAVSMWPPERIRKFLEDVVTGPDGQLISSMEQLVLENHLMQYFKA